LVVRSKWQAIGHGRDVAVDLVHGGVFGPDLVPGAIEFFGHQHHEAGVDALAHFCFGEHHGHQTISTHLDPTVERKLALVQGQLPVAQLLPVGAAAHGKAASGQCSRDQKVTPLDLHLNLLSYSPTGQQPALKPECTVFGQEACPTQDIDCPAKGAFKDPSLDFWI
jgi:hypothetical protein